ncbi:hypothetical protein FJW10_19615 [Mesorhizobium sp. B4-1-1]|nr:hypothetical protein FJW10_19615 [Mesorhizobium sp. B4-1-1]
MDAAAFAPAAATGYAPCFRVAETSGPVSCVRLDACPDGGISRVRLWGKVDPAARRAAGLSLVQRTAGGQAGQVLVEQGISVDLAES